MSVITEVFKYSRSWIWGYLKPILKIFFTKTGKALLELAVELVQKAAEDPAFVTGDPEKRRRWVAERIKEKNLETGVAWADSVINLAIEIAVQKLKNEIKK